MIMITMIRIMIMIIIIIIITTTTIIQLAVIIIIRITCYLLFANDTVINIPIVLASSSYFVLDPQIWFEWLDC